MKTISVHDAKTNLSKYIAAAKNGEVVFIGPYGKADVVLLNAKSIKSLPHQRNFTVAKGRITANADAFTGETDQEIARLLLG